MNTMSSLKRTVSYALFMAFIAAQSAHAGWFGPDVELLPPAQIGERLRNEAALFTSGGSALQIKTKGAAVGGFLVGMIIGSAVSSGGGTGGATNAAQLNSQMQANVAIAQQSSAHIQGAVTTAANNAAGQQSSDSAKLGPLSRVVKQLNRAFNEQGIVIADSATDPAPTLKLSLTQKTWLLDFSMASSDYTLSGGLLMELLDTHSKKIHLRQTCVREHPKKMSLEAWEVDNYQEVATAAEAIAQQCAEEFAVALNIPLPLPEANLAEPVDTVDEEPAATSEPQPSDVAAP